MMSRYDDAVHEVESVLSEWRDSDDNPSWPVGYAWNDRIARVIVDRLVAKGVIQSTDPDDLRGDQHIHADYRTGPLEPGRKVVGGD
jgi:hypothetical protein